MADDGQLHVVGVFLRKDLSRVVEMVGHKGAVQVASFSPVVRNTNYADGVMHIATGGMDCSVAVW